MYTFSPLVRDLRLYSIVLTPALIHAALLWPVSESCDWFLDFDRCPPGNQLDLFFTFEVRPVSDSLPECEELGRLLIGVDPVVLTPGSGLHGGSVKELPLEWAGTCVVIGRAGDWVRCCGRKSLRVSDFWSRFVDVVNGAGGKTLCESWVLMAYGRGASCRFGEASRSGWKGGTGLRRWVSSKTLESVCRGDRSLERRWNLVLFFGWSILTGCTVLVVSTSSTTSLTTSRTIRAEGELDSFSKVDLRELLDDMVNVSDRQSFVGDSVPPTLLCPTMMDFASFPVEVCQIKSVE